MAELNFPQDRTELDPPGTGPLQTGDEYRANGTVWIYDSVAKAWGSGGSGDSLSDLYLSKVIADTAADVISFDAGAQLKNLPNTPVLATDADGNIIASTVASQDLGYTADGNNAGTVTITDGADATIPVATNSVAGLFTGTEKQKLAGIASGAGANQNLGYNANGDAAGTVTITNGTNAVIPIATNTVAGLFKGSERQKLNGLLTTTQNDARYLRIDSASGNQTRVKGNTSFTERIIVGDGSQITTTVTGSGRAYIYCAASGATRWAGIALPDGSKAYGAVDCSNAFGGSANSQAAAFFSPTDNANNSKELIGLYSRSGSTNKKCGIIQVNHNLGEPRHVTDNTYGFGFGCKSTSGGNQAACITFYGRTSSTYHRAGYIKAGGEGNGAYVRITSTNGSAPATTFETDTRNVTSVTPLPSAVNLVKALNPSLIELNNGNTVVSFPFNATKLTTAYAAIGSETEEDEGEPQFAGVDHGRLVPVLTKALQEALEKIETLETRLNDAGIA